MHRAILLAALLVGAAFPASAGSAVNCAAPGAPTCVRAAFSGTAAITGSVRPGRIGTIQYVVPIVELRWTLWTATRAVGFGRLLECGVCTPFPGVRVRVELLRPVEYFCGPDEASQQSMGRWFSRARVSSRWINGTRKILGDGHPNAC